jgi:hypothetical protein
VLCWRTTIVFLNICVAKMSSQVCSNGAHHEHNTSSFKHIKQPLKEMHNDSILHDSHAIHSLDKYTTERARDNKSVKFLIPKFSRCTHTYVLFSLRVCSKQKLSLFNVLWLMKDYYIFFDGLSKYWIINFWVFFPFKKFE